MNPGTSTEGRGGGGATAGEAAVGAGGVSSAAHPTGPVGPACARTSVALILMSYGTPDGPDAVEPYLYNIFTDPDIIELPWFMSPFRRLLARKISKSRAPEVRHNYGRLGGKSPLLELTQAQGDALVKALSGDGSFRVVMGMRYWRPRTIDALRKIVDEGIREIVLLPMYPQYAKATTGSAINDFKRAVRELGLRDIVARAICCFPDNPRMIKAMAQAILKEMEPIPVAERAATPLLFSAHGLPKAVVDRGDPYQGHVERTVAAVVKEMGGHDNVTICYQSRVGRMEWIRPYTEDVIRDLIEKKVKRIVLYPVAFVTEHSETLFELDLLYGDQIRAAGIEFHRVPALGTDPLFIEALADEVRGALAGPPLSLR